MTVLIGVSRLDQPVGPFLFARKSTGAKRDSTQTFFSAMKSFADGTMIQSGLFELAARMTVTPILEKFPEKRMSAIESFGEALPGLLLESVVDPDHPGHLLLHTWNVHRTTTARKIEHGGVSYIPKNLTSGLVQSVRFAPQSLTFGSTAKVVSSLRDFLSTYARLQPGVADLLVAFGLATWFCDCMPVAPVLYLFGPDGAVSQVLRLLGCLCRRPVLLGDVDFEGLATLPNRLGATLLINQ